MVEKGGQWNLYYCYGDRLGSIVAVTDKEGNVVERYAYTPWGERRDPSDWTKPDSRTALLFNRGFTGHEHLDTFNLIDMGGRMYDPMLSSFLSIDPYIQAPDNWLNYNRYLYCYGNPLIYTDPLGLFSNDSESGSLFFRVDAELSIGLQVSTNIDVGLNVGFNFIPASITLLEISSIQKDNDTTPWQTQLNIAGQGGTSKVNSEYSIMGTGLQQSFVTDGTQNSSNVEESISLLGVTFYKGGGVSFKLDFGASMGLGFDFSIEFGKRNF